MISSRRWLSQDFIWRAHLYFDFIWGLFKKGSKVKEGVEEGVLEAFDEFGEEGRGLREFKAIKGLDGA